MDTVEKILAEMREKVRVHGMPNYLINEIWDWETRLAKIVSPALHDAARYRWLRDMLEKNDAEAYEIIEFAYRGGLTSAIDAAMNGANA